MTQVSEWTRPLTEAYAQPPSRDIYYAWVNGETNPWLLHYCLFIGSEHGPGWAWSCTPRHTLISRDPLHLEASIGWTRCCGRHGFIRGGLWIPAGDGRLDAMTKPHRWHHHPGVRSGDQLTVGERLADSVRDRMGSWGFVIAFLGGMACWALLQWALGPKAFDPYPYILLNLGLSMMAGLQGAILLIAAKRADQIAAELAIHTDRATQELLAIARARQEKEQT